jgi:hypothetical protein
VGTSCLANSVAPEPLGAQIDANEALLDEPHARPVIL